MNFYSSCQTYSNITDEFFDTNSLTSLSIYILVLGLWTEDILFVYLTLVLYVVNLHIHIYVCNLLQ